MTEKNVLKHLNYKRSSANDFHETFALKRFHIENVVLKKSLIFLTSQAIRKTRRDIGKLNVQYYGAQFCKKNLISDHVYVQGAKFDQPESIKE